MTLEKNKKNAIIKKLLLLIICLSCQMIHAQDRLQDSTEGFSFEINYWFNMHHFLWMESFINVEKDSTLIDQNIAPDAQKILARGLAYYKDSLTEYNLRSSDYMTEFKHWITTQDFELSQVPTKFQEHVDILQEVSAVYMTAFWPIHKAACEKVLSENIDLIRRTEERYAYGIQELTRQRWQNEKIKVDITYYGTATTWNFNHRPYTTLFPTHVVMNAIGENEVEGNWVELLFHEAAHHLILGSSYFVSGTIKDVSEVMDVKPPRSFWHAYLFYLTGELTKQVFAEEELNYKTTYMQRTGVFGRYYALLDKYLKPYMDREVTLAEATRKILTELK